MGIADVLGTLTVRDESYKKVKALTEALRILDIMCEDNHIDAVLFKLIFDQKRYQRYADQYMNLEQIDEVDHSNIPG